MSDFLREFSSWILPLLLLSIPLWGLFRRVQIYSAFTSGVKEGLKAGLRIAPYLLAILVAISVFRASGGINLLVAILSPVLKPLGVPAEVLPLGLLRPLSGSGSLGFLAELLDNHGPDSFIGFTASSIQGSTETTFFVLTVYLGAVGLKRLRHTWMAGLIGDIVGFMVAVWVARVLF